MIRGHLTPMASIMKKQLLLTAAIVSSGLALAQDYGRVISAMPILQQVSTPRQVCTTEQVNVQQPKSGAGAVMGAIAGGAMGNARRRRLGQDGCDRARPGWRGHD